jgi:hypothetical protein
MGRRFATVSRMLTYLLPHLRNGALAQKAGDFSARAGARPAANLSLLPVTLFRDLRPL